MTVSALWTVACVVTPFLIILYQPTAVAAAGAGQTGGSGCKGDVKDLHVMGFYPFVGTWHGGKSLLVSTKLAIDQINNICVVPGYRLVLHDANTECDTGRAIHEFFSQLKEPTIKLSILGPACSVVSEIIARVSQYWNIVQVAFLSFSPTMSDKAKFPRFARVSTPETMANPARISLFNHFNWTNICTLHHNFHLFANTVEDLLKRLRDKGFTMVRSEVFSSDPDIQVANLVKHKCRIIAAFSYEDKARKVFCVAYRLGLYGRDVVWVLVGWFEQNWWKLKDDSINCTLQEMEEAVRGHFVVGFLYYNPNPEPTVSGWLPSNFTAAYMAKVNYTTLDGQALASQGYDAAWALALALNATRNTLLADGRGKFLENFTYEDEELSALLYSNLRNVSFTGVRGPIYFDANGDSVGMVNVLRYQRGEMVLMARFDPLVHNIVWSDESVIWEGGVVPRDSAEKRNEKQRLSLWVYVAMCLLAALGIALAVVFLAFNIIMRDVRVVKMSSPRLNNVILLGCIFCYSSVFLQDIGAEARVLMCQVKTALLVFGISLALGALFAKTWRVHIIFANKRLRKKVMSDGHLMGMVAVLVVINMIVLVTWWLNDPQTVKSTSNFTTEAKDIAGDVEVTHHQMSCVSDHQKYYRGVIYGIQGLLLLLGTLLAFETRNVHYPELNDSRLVGMCIYNVTILSIPAIVMGVVVDPELNIKYAISSGLVILGTTVTQCIIFLPKVTSCSHMKTTVPTSTSEGDKLELTTKFETSHTTNFSATSGIK